MQEYAVGSLVNIGMHAGARGYKRLALPCLRTDVARNKYAGAFLAHTRDPEATLIMLDADHNHPVDILERLARHDRGVVGALAYRRSEPYDPCAMIFGADGQLHSIAAWMPGADVVPCDVVGTGAIAIKRWVFEKLDSEGTPAPYFQYFYPPNTAIFPTEDVYFGLICHHAGIAHHVDVSLVTPHLTVAHVDGESWQQWMADHPDKLVDNRQTTASTPTAEPAPAGPLLAPPPLPSGNGNGNGKRAVVPARIITRVEY